MCRITNKFDVYILSLYNDTSQADFYLNFHLIKDVENNFQRVASVLF